MSLLFHFGKILWIFRKTDFEFIFISAKVFPQLMIMELQILTLKYGAAIKTMFA
jgi:hypothetical protein